MAPPAAAVLSTYCVSCHGAEKPKAGFRIDLLLRGSPSDDTLSAWKDVLNRLDSRDMPPRGRPRPTESEYDSAVAAIRGEFDRIEEASLASKPRALRRLNRTEYANTIRDLFGIRYRPGDDFPADGSLHGFDTVADGLTLSPALVEKYLAAADAVLDRAFRPVDPDHRPRTHKVAFYEEMHNYPADSQPTSGFGVYNGNAHLTFGPDGKKRVVYVGGPAIFSYHHIDPVNNPVHAFNSEGVYRLKASLTPRNFEPGELASFTVLGAEKRLVAEIDVPIVENGTAIVLQAETYYDRSESLVGFEINWTNGNHLQWPARGRLLTRPFDGSHHNTPWWHINHRMENGKRVDWRPQSPEELPFSYFEKIEFEVTGPIREFPKHSAELLGRYLEDHEATRVFERFLPRAFRRPATPAEVERYTA